ncbi:hypothetical protein ACWGKQ_26965 [Streptomyces sp. NPDC054770]
MFDPKDNAIEGYVNDYNLTTGQAADRKPYVAACTSTPPPNEPGPGKAGLNWADIASGGTTIATGSFNSGMHQGHLGHFENGFNSLISSWVTASRRLISSGHDDRATDPRPATTQVKARRRAQRRLHQVDQPRLTER